MTTTKTTRYDDFMDDLRGKLRAKYEASPELRAEFLCAGDYVAFELNSATARPLVRRWRQDFDAQAAEKALLAAEARANVRKAEGRRAVGRLRVAGC